VELRQTVVMSVTRRRRNWMYFSAERRRDDATPHDAEL